MKIYLYDDINGWILYDNPPTKEFSKRNIFIGEYVNIGESARIGESASIGEYASIGKSASIGEYARVVSILGGYKYPANAYRDEKTGISYVRLGCFIRSVADWEKDFDNNIKEFPIGSKDWKKRKAVYDYLKNWLEIEYGKREGEDANT